MSFLRLSSESSSFPILRIIKLFFLYLSREGASELRETVSVPVEKAYIASIKFSGFTNPSSVYFDEDSWIVFFILSRP